MQSVVYRMWIVFHRKQNLSLIISKPNSANLCETMHKTHNLYQAMMMMMLLFCFFAEVYAVDRVSVIQRHEQK